MNPRAMAASMADELEHSRLDVVLSPAPSRNHPCQCVRTVQSRNPDWYRELCRARESAAHPRRNRFDTAIKRQHVITGLRRIAAGKPAGYHANLLDQAIQHQLTRYQESA
jgi:hypothetical protein